MAKRTASTDETPADTATTVATRVSVINRRLNNPFSTPSRTVPLTGRKRNWVVRTFASDPEHPDRHYDAVHRLGWIPLEADDLAVTPESIGYTVATDGRIVRGPRGTEVLMGMPTSEFEKIQAAKSRENLRKMGAAYTKTEVAQATAKEHGDQAGDTIADHFEQREIVEPI